MDKITPNIFYSNKQKPTKVVFLKKLYIFKNILKICEPHLI